MLTHHFTTMVQVGPDGVPSPYAIQRVEHILACFCSHLVSKLFEHESNIFILGTAFLAGTCHGYNKSDHHHIVATGDDPYDSHEEACPLVSSVAPHPHLGSVEQNFTHVDQYTVGEWQVTFEVRFIVVVVQLLNVLQLIGIPTVNALHPEVTRFERLRSLRSLHQPSPIVCRFFTEGRGSTPVNRETAVRQ